MGLLYVDLTGIRVSVTQRCNLNCIYCHREGCASAGDLPLPFFQSLISLCPDHGIVKLKITGGEPLMRKDLAEIVHIGDRWMDEISLTTNGTLLSEERSRSLAHAGLDRINVSLDSFNEELYRKLTGQRKGIERVICNLEKAQRFFYPIKINMVLLKDLNESEVPHMIQFCKDRGYILQLIELQPFDSYRTFNDLFLDLGDMERELGLKAQRVEIRKMQNRKKYFVDGAEIEVVKPMHNSEFCRNCRRIRLTSEGKIKPCLMRNDNLVDGLAAFQTRGLTGLEEALSEGINRRNPFWATISHDRYI